MDHVKLKDLKIKSRDEGLKFLHMLWYGEKRICPFCSNELEPLHKKAKESDNDWQCKQCNKIFKAMDLMHELNEQIPK